MPSNKNESEVPNFNLISKKNFEKNLKNANLEIMRLRKEVQEKNKQFEKLKMAYQEVLNSKEKDALSTN